MTLFHQSSSNIPLTGAEPESYPNSLAHRRGSKSTAKRENQIRKSTKVTRSEVEVALAAVERLAAANCGISAPSREINDATLSIQVKMQNAARESHRTKATAGASENAEEAKTLLPFGTMAYQTKEYIMAAVAQ